jgi:hypothetical protein
VLESGDSSHAPLPSLSTPSLSRVISLLLSQATALAQGPVEAYGAFELTVDDSAATDGALGQIT